MKIFSEMIKDVIEKIFNAFARRQIKLGGNYVTDFNV